MATLFTDNELAPMESIMSQLYCNALGQSCSFPRLSLHGPMELGCLRIPMVRQKVTRSRLNYFLFNIQCSSNISKKLEKSVVITKLELGLFDQFFSNPHQRPGHLTSPMLCVQLWYETEPHALILCLAPYATWVPYPQDKMA